MMIRVMLDSDSLGDLPSGIAPLLATYSDLIHDRHQLDLLAEHHLGSVIVLIDRGLGDPTGLASVADVERGAMTPGHLKAWWKARVSRVPYLTAYCDRSNLAACDAALAGIAPRHWRWVATLDGTVAVAGMTPLLRPAVVQVAGSAMLGVHADLSLVLNKGWHA
jgi:hypothetical protein